MSIKDLIMAHPLAYRLISSVVDRDKIKAISRLRRDFSGLKVLDLGCGTGNSAPIFPGCDYTGIDINQRYIDLAARQHPGFNFVAADINRVEWGDGFDIILINSLLHHLADNQVSEILLKSAAALNRTGNILIQEPLIPGQKEWCHRLMMHLDRGNYFRSLPDWKRLIEEADLFTENIFFYSLRVLGFKGYHLVSISLEKRT